jgi:hypothetical protein
MGGSFDGKEETGRPLPPDPAGELRQGEAPAASNEEAEEAPHEHPQEPWGTREKNSRTEAEQQCRKRSEPNPP